MHINVGAMEKGLREICVVYLCVTDRGASG